MGTGPAQEPCKCWGDRERSSGVRPFVACDGARTRFLVSRALLFQSKGRRTSTTAHELRGFGGRGMRRCADALPGVIHLFFSNQKAGGLLSRRTNCSGLGARGMRRCADALPEVIHLFFSNQKKRWSQKKDWSGREDSNLRPLAPHASALPGCATSRPVRWFSARAANDS